MTGFQEDSNNQPSIENFCGWLWAIQTGWPNHQIAMVGRARVWQYRKTEMFFTDKHECPENVKLQEQFIEKYMKC